MTKKRLGKTLRPPKFLSLSVMESVVPVLPMEWFAINHCQSAEMIVFPLGQFQCKERLVACI